MKGLDYSSLVAGHFLFTFLFLFIASGQQEDNIYNLSSSIWQLGINRKRTHLLLAPLTNQLHSMIDAHRFSKNKRGTGILGITFFTALWILYVAKCALHAAAETDRSVCNSMFISVPLLGVTKQPETY